MQGNTPSEPALDQLAVLRTSILDDVFKDFNQTRKRWIRHLLEPLAWFSVHRFAELMLHLDYTIYKDGFRQALQDLADYFGEIQAFDASLGVLIDELKNSGQYDNTLFIFTSDNGAEASGPADPQDFATARMTSSLGYHTDYETLGLKGSYNTISPSFGFSSSASE